MMTPNLIMTPNLMMIDDSSSSKKTILFDIPTHVCNYKSVSICSRAILVSYGLSETCFAKP